MKLSSAIILALCALASDVAHGAPSSATSREPIGVFDAEQCVALARGHSAKLEEARARVWQMEARLRIVESSVYPKLQATAFLAPAYTVRGSGYDPNPIIRYKKLSDWGPYTNVEARLIQPLYSFGRLSQGKQAARERLLSEEEKFQVVSQEVSRQVRQMYYTHAYVSTLRGVLREARALVKHALALATEKLQHGQVTQADYGRLAHGDSELSRRLAELEESENLSLRALKQLMGTIEEHALRVKDERLPMPPRAFAESLQAQLRIAALSRPEHRQLNHGQRALVALERAERLAMMPQLILVGQFNAAWTPTRDRDRSPWHYDMYNRLAGGLALALHIDLDVAQAQAKAKEAAMIGAEVRALARYAAGGIALEVSQAHEGLRRAHTSLVASEADTVSSRRWLTFAKAAMASGTGEARDVFDALLAYLEARQSHLSAALLWWLKESDLIYATGVADRSQLAPLSLL